MCSTINNLMKHISDEISKEKRKSKVVPKDYTNIEQPEQPDQPDQPEQPITSTRTNTISLKDENEFVYYINEIADWTYIIGGSPTKV